MAQWNIDLKIRATGKDMMSIDNTNVVCTTTAQNHLKVVLHQDAFWNTDSTVYMVKKEIDVETVESIRKVHENTYHKGIGNLLHAYRNAGKLTPEVRKVITNVVENCNVCKKYKRSQRKPKVALTKVTDFNQIVTLDLKQFGDTNVLWIICSFTRFVQGIVLPDKSAEAIVEGLNTAWNWRFSFPSTGFWMDNGSEFQNKELNEYASKWGFTVTFGPTYSPWSNGLNERNHYSADVTVKKIRETDKKITLKKAIEMAAWTHNTNTSVLGYDPMSLVTGKSVTFPGISSGNVATESLFDSDAVKKIMERHHEITKAFREVEYGSKLVRAANQTSRSFQDIQYKEGDWVFYQPLSKKAWFGPVKVFVHRGNDVWVWANGDLKKIAACKVQPYVVGEDLEVLEEDRDIEPVTLTKPVTRSAKLKEAKKDTIGAYWMTLENNECFDGCVTTYVVEVPVKEHKAPEVLEAKETEVENLKAFDTFEEVLDVGQEKLGTRWVVTRKEVHDGQKKACKARIVAKGFHETVKPQADSPTALRESIKIFLAIAANEGFDLEGVDIRAAFLQSNVLDRDVYLEPPKDLKKPGILWFR